MTETFREPVANIKQQKKRIRTAERQRMENLQYRSTLKTFFRRLGVAIDEGDAEKVSAEHLQYQKLVDLAAARKALHPNTAARKKSRAARMVAAGPREVKKKPRKAATAATARKAPTRKAVAKK